MADYRPLFDAWGEAIPREQIAALREETAPIGAIYARPPFQGHLAWGINPERLAAIIRAADSGNTLDWFILAEEIEELYPHYSAVLAKRRRQVAQLPITVTAADADNPDFEKHAELIRAWLRTATLQQALFDVLDAVGKGFSMHEIVWEQTMEHCWPKEFIYHPQRHFEFNYLDGKTIWLRTERGFEDLVPHKWLVHRHPSKSGMIFRSSLTRMVAFLWCFATFTAKDWALFTQAYGLPVRLGRYGTEASDTDKRVLWRAVQSIAGDVAAIIPKTMEMEFITAPDRGAGATLYERRADWLDRAVSKLVLGSTAGTDAIAAGLGGGHQHRAAEDDVEKFDAGLLADTLNRQIIPHTIAFTFGPQPAYPVATIGRPNEVPLRELVAAVQGLGGMGLKVKASELRDRMQLTKPEEGDEVVGGVPASMTERVEVQAPADPGDVAIPNTNQAALIGPLGRVLAAREDAPEVVAALTQRLGAEAAAALHGLTEQVRGAILAARDYRDMERRLRGLTLDPDAYATAMARGMALAHLAGQASLIEELTPAVHHAAALTARRRD